MRRVLLIALTVFISWIAEVAIHNLAPQESLIALTKIEEQTQITAKYGAVFPPYKKYLWLKHPMRYVFVCMGDAILQKRIIGDTRITANICSCAYVCVSVCQHMYV